MSSAEERPDAPDGSLDAAVKSFGDDGGAPGTVTPPHVPKVQARRRAPGGPLGALFVGVGNGAFGALDALRRSSKTLIRLDLRKPRVWDLRRGARDSGVSPAVEQEEARAGQRLKLMRQWELAAPGGGSGKASFAIGANYSIDEGVIEARARLHTPLVNVRLLPQPELCFRRLLSIGGSGIALDARYDLPLSEVGWVDSRLRLRLVSTGGRGIHLTQDGLELDEQAIKLGEATAAGVKSASTLRVSAAMQVPREWPIKDEQPLIRLSLNRLALRVVIDK